MAKAQLPQFVRTDLNGIRVKSPNHIEVYLIDMGLRRHIPNDSTYNALFQSHDDIRIDPHCALIEEGPPILDGAELVKCLDQPEVYLIDRLDGRKTVRRHVISSEVNVMYNFQPPTIVPKEECEAIDIGPDVDGPDPTP